MSSLFSFQVKHSTEEALPCFHSISAQVADGHVSNWSICRATRPLDWKEKVGMEMEMRGSESTPCNAGGNWEGIADEKEKVFQSFAQYGHKTMPSLCHICGPSSQHMHGMFPWYSYWCKSRMLIYRYSKLGTTRYVHLSWTIEDRCHLWHDCNKICRAGNPRLDILLSWPLIMSIGLHHKQDICISAYHCLFVKGPWIPTNLQLFFPALISLSVSSLLLWLSWIIIPLFPL